jgi:hypothetical protein
MVSKGQFTMDAKIVDNNGSTAYVTSGPSYNPAKAGTKESKATVITSRTLMKARRLLRIMVGRNQSVPIFVELRKNIIDPEVHILKAVIGTVQEALDPNHALAREIGSMKALKDVPTDWLPKPGEYEELFGTGESANLLVGALCIEV